jgi:hypothetical protein
MTNHRLLLLLLATCVPCWGLTDVTTPAVFVTARSQHQQHVTHFVLFFIIFAVTGQWQRGLHASVAVAVLG